jgi:hypothetical protein
MMAKLAGTCRRDFQLLLLLYFRPHVLAVKTKLINVVLNKKLCMYVCMYVCKELDKIHPVLALRTLRSVLLKEGSNCEIINQCNRTMKRKIL